MKMKLWKFLVTITNSFHVSLNSDDASHTCIAWGLVLHIRTN